jgi:hypothetical protein
MRVIVLAQVMGEICFFYVPVGIAPGNRWDFGVTSLGLSLYFGKIKSPSKRAFSDGSNLFNS